MRALFFAAVLLGLAACGQPGGQPPAVTPDTVQQPAPDSPKITATQLLGKSDAWVLQHLGEPTFKRADILANLWQYKNSHCVLNLFLYANDPANAALIHVLHFDARDAQGRSTDRGACLDALQP